MPLKATFGLWPGDDEEGRLEPRELLEKLREREDEDKEDESRRRGPEEEAGEADCFPPLREDSSATKAENHASPEPKNCE